MLNRPAYIQTYRDILDESLFGGKFAKQSVMSKQGVNVPKFFCLSPEAYKSVYSKIRDQINEVLERIDWGSQADVKKAEQKIRTLFLKQNLDESIQKQIVEFFDDFFGEKEYVSVRSSMVAKDANLSEDSSEHAFAGMSESFLYVTKNDVLEKILECFASGYSSQVLLYRHSLNVDDLDFSVSVGIQEMVFGVKSFVCFTCDPNTMAKDTLIVAGYGIGEGVVQEKVETDHYFVKSKTDEIVKSIADKKCQLLMDKERGWGLKEFPVAEEESKGPVFSDSEIKEVSAQAKKIENIFQFPQDVEGCFDEDGKLYFLQSRPIQIDQSQQIIWSNANVTESFPGTTTPLTFHFARRFYEVIFRDCYRSLGVPASKLKESDDMLKNMIGFHSGKVYYNLTSFYKLHSLSPLFPFFKKQWEDMMGFSGAFYVADEKKSFWANLKKASGALYTFYGVLIISWRYLTNQRDVESFLKRWEFVMKDFRGKNYAETSPFEMMKQYKKLWANVEHGWWITLLNDTHLPTAYRVTEFLMKKWVDSEDDSLMSNLLCGEEELKSVEIIYSGISLSERVKKNPALKELFLSHDDAKNIWKAIIQDESFSDFKNELERHLYMFGDRGLQELKLEQPNIRHHPDVLVQMIKNYLERDVSVEKAKFEEMKSRERGEKELELRLKNSPLKRFVLKFQLSRLRGFIRNRENMRYCRSEFFGVSKNLFRAIGKDFEKNGVLSSCEDIFFLTTSEIEDLIYGASSIFNAKENVKLRKSEFEENKEVELPMDFVTNGAVYKNHIRAQDQEEQTGDMVGLGSCPGIVRGRARVVLDPNEVGKLEEDEILIARETDPGWLFLMLAAKGIVVERGSMLSHTAITGRKFGIPTIVSVPGITKRLSSGQEIEIDGSKGTVEVI